MDLTAHSNSTKDANRQASCSKNPSSENAATCGVHDAIMSSSDEICIAIRHP